VTFYLLSSQAATCYYQSNYSKVQAIPRSALPKDTTSELVGLSSHNPFLMLNIKQGSCEYQLLKSLASLDKGIETRSLANEVGNTKESWMSSTEPVIL